MKLDWRLVLVLVMSLGLMVSCESTEEEEDEATAFEILSEYMLEQNLDEAAVVDGFIITAEQLSGNEAEYFVIDARSASFYEAGHIPTAVNCTDKTEVLTLVETENTDNLPIVVTCWSGQSATPVVTALRLSGYTDAKSLKWGMSSWHTNIMDTVEDTLIAKFDSWTSSCASIAVGNANWVPAADAGTAAPALLSGNDDPVIETEYTDGAAILAERVELILAAGASKSGADVLDAPENFQINNRWGLSDYNTLGHFVGSFQTAGGSLSIADDGLDALDPTLEIVTYCWTGQTSGMMSSWLRVLGYDAYSLSKGANTLIYDNLADGPKKWDPTAIVDLDLEY